ncbi:MAG: RNA polymerase sigma factor [Planctomycetota bacterium]|jgi:RNA polymerase sigma-70 factor (ECF subfamily)|nr:RNA polymerase sigma factor [Planctomycetota bacterium]
MLEMDEFDRKDVEAVLAGDEEAFERLFVRHNQAVAKQMRNFAKNPDAAEELCHDVFVEAYLSLGKFRGEAPFRHWLARIATLTGYKYWRVRGKEKRNLPLPADQPAPEVTERDPAAAADLLFDLLALLPAADRLLLTLMYLEHLGQDEIASRIGATRVMVAVRIFRAKKKLKAIGEKEPWKGRIAWILS